MMGNSFNLLQTILLYAIPLLFAITLHEVAHGWAANSCGDATARMLGRLSLNPIKHIDPVGTILIPAITLYSTGFIFGWAKPVPVNWANLRHPRRDMALVALAGPGSNLVMAFIWALIAKATIMISGTQAPLAQALVTMSAIGIQINLILMVLNLLPLPPLDGSRVITSFLPSRWVYELQKIERLGFIILILLLATGILSKIITPFITFFHQAILHLVGLG